jgi:phosphoenolpyruvate carboxykinase (ATP)
MPIRVTRTLLNAALEGRLADAPMRTDRYFGFAVPKRVEGVDASILDPRETWSDKAAYDAMARKLVGMFVKNFAKFEAMVEADVRAASPAAQIAAE